MPRRTLAVMSLLLPQTRTGVIQAVRPVNIHGDLYVDVLLALDGEVATAQGRVSQSECPADLTPGDRVSVRFTLGVMTRVAREPA